MGPWVRDWLKDQSVPKLYAVTLTTAWQQVMPRDDMRYAMTLPFSTAANVLFAFSDATPASFQFANGTSSSWIYLSGEEIGDMITFPLWAQLSVGTLACTFLAQTYNVQRKGFYDALVRSELLKLRAP